MTGWLFDTNVISQASSAEPGPKVVSFVADQPLESLHINVITLVEIRFAIEVLADVTRRSACKLPA